jgi:hypothetical protein
MAAGTGPARKSPAAPRGLPSHWLYYNGRVKQGIGGSTPSVGIIANMKASLVLRTETEIERGLRAEAVVWRVPVPVRGSQHFYKYRVALIDEGVCVLRYDNEAGKGDHKHIGDVEFTYEFSTVQKLGEDFLNDVAEYRRRR